MASIALLARILDRDDFLSYTVLLRYLSLAIVVLGAGTGFSFIGSKGKNQDIAQTAELLLKVLFVSLSVGFLLWLLVCYWLVMSSYNWPKWTILSYVWVVAHTTFILSGPVARANGGVGRYVKLALGCRTAPYVVGVILVLLTGEFIGLFVGYGLFSGYWLWRFWARVGVELKLNFEMRSALSILRFGLTRWFDDIVRTLLPVALILATSFLLGREEAAVVALVYLVARVLESMLQPLVIALMMRGRLAVPSLGRDIWRIVILLLVLTTLLFILRPHIEQFFEFFLGSAYQDITNLCWLMLLSAGSIMGLSYLRGCYDNNFSHSPVFFINLIFIIILISAVTLCDTVHEVILSSVLVHWGRLLTYSAALIVLLRRSRSQSVKS